MKNGLNDWNVILADYEIEADVISDQSDLMTGKVQIMQGDLLTGFELPIQKLAVITEEELFTKRAKRRHSVNKNYQMPKELKITLN